MNSTELYNRYISEQAAGGGSGDVVWSSSMDTALKLATEYAEQYASPEVKQLPDWAVWQQKAYGTTYEPVVFIYNKRLIPQNEVPDSHTALAKLIASQADKFKGKVTTYDIEKSGLGFMLAVQDSQHPNAAKLWLDYVLSEKGQQILASQADIPSIRRDIEGKNDIDGMTALLGKALKPIPVNETLLDYLQPQKRLQFIKQWRSAAAK